jgi:hypothetical protein
LIAASLTFLTPRGGLLALTAAVPLAAFALASRRERRARAVLGLSAPGRGRRWWPALIATAVACLLGVAASQPVLRSTSSIGVRTDAEALFVIDISRSMLASRAPGARTRITRARDDAIRLRDQLIDIPSGVATMTDRVLPDLLPVPDRDSFEQTVRQAVQIDDPPPGNDAVTATTLGALGALGTQSFYAPSARHRVAIVLTDGESRPFDANQTARALGHVSLFFIRIGSSAEHIFDADGQLEPAYHPDASSTEALAGLARAAHTRTFRDGELGAVASAVRATLGTGPMQREGLTATTRALGPYIALAALVPLLLLLARNGSTGRASGRRASESQSRRQTRARARRQGASAA